MPFIIVSSVRIWILTIITYFESIFKVIPYIKSVFIIDIAFFSFLAINLPLNGWYFMTAWLPLPIPQKLTRYLWKVRDQAGHGNWEYCQGQDPKFPPISELWIERQCGKVEMRKVSAFYAQSKGNSLIIESHMKRLYRFIVIFWTFYAICTNMQANGRTFFWVTSSKFVPVLVPTAAQ